MPTREPIFNVPAAVMGAIGLMVLIHTGLWYLGEDEETRLKLMLSFFPARYSAGASRLPGDWPGAQIWSFVSHQLVHGDWTHLAMNSAWLLAFGGAVAARIGNWRFILLGLLSGIAGAAFFLAFRWGEAVPMVGASGAVSGLMGGAFRFFFNHTDAMQRFGDPNADPRSVPRMSLRQTFTDRRVLTVVAIWVVLNFVTAAASFLLTSGAGIAWEAHLGGFLLGILGFAVFDAPKPAPDDHLPPPDPASRTLH
ncbi:MAG: rhomboid family intramembrane serine protease [Hyphomicrobiaceae bacterium]